VGRVSTPVVSDRGFVGSQGFVHKRALAGLELFMDISSLRFVTLASAAVAIIFSASLAFEAG
jgi:hypothetical protein